MGTTGVIFAAIAIAWLAYLVPHFAHRREAAHVEASDPADRFSHSVRVVRHGTAPLLDQDLSEMRAYEVSTPQTRRAALRNLHRLEALAAARRRRVLLVLFAAFSVMLGLCALEVAPWGLLALPGGLLVTFVVLSRVSVTAMHRTLDARYEEIRQGSTEATVFLSRPAPQSHGSHSYDAMAAVRVGLAEAAAASSHGEARGLWDPVPITVPTYVSKPLAPRTVRTIDLSGPAVTLSAPTEEPVTADPRPAATVHHGSHQVAAEELAMDDHRRAASA